MTYEEAHRFLEVKQRDMTQNRHLYNEMAIAINGKAIEALEKQIPQKPNIEHQPICDLYKCPICNKLLIVYYPGMELFTGEETEFCDHCGQAIDWRKRNEQRNNKRSL